MGGPPGGGPSRRCCEIGVWWARRAHNESPSRYTACTGKLPAATACPHLAVMANGPVVITTVCSTLQRHCGRRGG
jgi:hypothetical protein